MIMQNARSKRVRHAGRAQKLTKLTTRVNSLLKTTFKALRRWRGCPWRIGQVVAAALVVLHHEHRRTT
jgi:hypothetical protein